MSVGSSAPESTITSRPTLSPIGPRVNSDEEVEDQTQEQPRKRLPIVVRGVLLPSYEGRLLPPRVRPQPPPAEEPS